LCRSEPRQLTDSQPIADRSRLHHYRYGRLILHSEIFDVALKLAGDDLPGAALVGDEREASRRPCRLAPPTTTLPDTPQDPRSVVEDDPSALRLDDLAGAQRLQQAT